MSLFAESIKSNDTLGALDHRKFQNKEFRKSEVSTAELGCNPKCLAGDSADESAATFVTVSAVCPMKFILTVLLKIDLYK